MTGTETERPTAPHTPPGPLSFEQFLAWCDEDVWAEWIEGSVIMGLPASFDHQDIRDVLLFIMRLFVERHQAGRVISAPFLMRLAQRPSGREPDILFVAQARLDLLQPTYLDGPADLVVEIVSPESASRDRGEKFVEYEGAGVREYWLIDPLRREARFYQLGEEGRYADGPVDADGVYRSPVLEGFWLRPAWLWQRPLPQVTQLARELGLL